MCGLWWVQVTYLGHDSSTTWTDYAIEWNDYEVRTHKCSNIMPFTMGSGRVWVDIPDEGDKRPVNACLSLPHRFHCRPSLLSLPLPLPFSKPYTY
jgi:hypothetical protein